MAVWAGGLEPPVYVFQLSKELIKPYVEDWLKEVKPEEGDYIDVLEINSMGVYKYLTLDEITDELLPELWS